MSPRGLLTAGRWPGRTGRLKRAIPVCQPCPVLPFPPKAGSFANGLVVIVAKVGQREVSAGVWHPHLPSGLAWVSPGKSPGLPQGLASGQRPGCCLHTGSLVPVARLPCGSVYRKSWTSARRYHLFWASSSATPTSHRAPRSMRRLRVERVPAGEQPR